MTNALTTAWLAARLGAQPARVEALRRAGRLVALRRADGQHVFPAWQFGRDGRPHADVARLVAAAREKGIDDTRLHELVTRRAGIVGGTRPADACRQGDFGPALRAIAAV
jgi:hypothetical protein